MSTTLNRRVFLRQAGVSLGLPVFSSLLPRGVRAAGTTEARRLVAICSPLGFHTPFLFPQKAGKDYESTPYLEPLMTHRDKFTVISGLRHLGVDGGHPAEKSFLTGAAHPNTASFRNTISLDQYAAEQIGHHTRYPSISLSAAHTGISYTRSGVLIPPESRPSVLFARLFLEGSAEQKAAQLRRIKDGRSIMDLVLDQTKSVARRVGREDLAVFDQYLTSIREFEQRLVAAEEWAGRPKPKVEAGQPKDVTDRADFSGRMRLLYDLMVLAIQTDSCRLFTFLGAGGNEVVDLKGVDDGWHNLSHHSKSAEKIEKLAIIEKEEMRLFAEFVGKLDSIREGDRSLLDQTAILLGSSLGNASAHTNANLPIIAAGGRFKHAGHLAFDPVKPPPLANLFVSFLQHLELEADRFSSGTGTLSGIDLVA